MTEYAIGCSSIDRHADPPFASVIIPTFLSSSLDAGGVVNNLGGGRLPFLSSADCIEIIGDFVSSETGPRCTYNTEGVHEQEKKMSDLSKWLPFKFERRMGGKAGEESEGRIARRNGGEDTFERLNQEMSQMMRNFLGSDEWMVPSFRSAAQAPTWFGDFRPSKFAPVIDVADTDTHLVVSAEIPGLSKKDIEVTVYEGALNIKGEKRHELEKEENGVYRTERYFGAFNRTVPLPADINPDAAESRFENGVLTLRLPKLDGVTHAPKRIKI